jgi:hypothetical protein
MCATWLAVTGLLVADIKFSVVFMDASSEHMGRFPALHHLIDGAQRGFRWKFSETCITPPKLRVRGWLSVVSGEPAIFGHRQVRAARHMADVHGTLAQHPRRGLLEEIVVDEPYLLQAAVL